MKTCPTHGSIVLGPGPCPQCKADKINNAERSPICRCPTHHKDFIGAACPECADALEANIEARKQKEFDPNGKAPSQIGDCLDEAKKTICGERQDVYGSPEDSFQIIADYWNVYLSGMPGSALVAKDIAHMMVLFKMARVQGQRPSRDNYVDLCGYAAIAADRLMGGNK